MEVLLFYKYQTVSTQKQLQCFLYLLFFSCSIRFLGHLKKKTGKNSEKNTVIEKVVLFQQEDSFMKKHPGIYEPSYIFEIERRVIILFMLCAFMKF